VAGAEFVRSTEVWDWVAVTSLIIDVMRKTTLGLYRLARAFTPPLSVRSLPGT
jgi:hypothetical protein